MLTSNDVARFFAKQSINNAKGGKKPITQVNHKSVAAKHQAMIKAQEKAVKEEK